MNFTWKWEAREKHWRDWQEIAESLGFLDSQKRVRRWDGKAFYALFNPRGHDHADFSACRCGMNLPEQMIGVDAS